MCRSHDHASALVTARELRSRVGGSRFLQTDPIEGGSANDYDYVGADPVNSFDLSGLCNSPEAWCVIGILRGTEDLPTIRRNGQSFRQFVVARGGSIRMVNSKAGIRRINGSGDCSHVPDSGAFFDFHTACAAHDLGYDLMRFFGSSGFLGSTRVSVDLLLLYDMQADCNGRGWFGAYEAPCRSLASSYYAGVTANSLLQRYAAP